jgi:hypothetical protein
MTFTCATSLVRGFNWFLSVRPIHISMRKFQITMIHVI